MIIEFTVGNFLSFNEKKTISFEAKRVSELQENVIQSDGYKLLRSLVVYGANSSGKSNLIKAFDNMKLCILSSVRVNETDKLTYSPFLLSSVSGKLPTFFEIVFILKNQTFRYGFEYNSTEIEKEWLFVVKNKEKEDPLFVRTNERITISDKFSEGKRKEGLTNNNRLFLSLVAQLGGKISKQILQWFNRDCNVLSGIYNDDMLSLIGDNAYNGFSFRMFLEKSNGYDEALKLFKDLQLGFEDIEFKLIKEEAKDLTSFRNDIVSWNTIHKKYDENKNVIDNISWNRNIYESDGTNKIIDLSGPIFDTLSKGKTLIIDELDSKLHPLITMQIIKLFNNPETNPNGAQLLFATHDTNLLSTDIFRRDQIWFTEKDETEQTDLYSLDDFVFPDGTKVRKDANLEKNYIAGRYGAIPYITNL